MDAAGGSCRRFPPSRLKDLPREDAARIAYRLLRLEHFVDGSPMTEMARHYEEFLRDYAGTAVAPFAEADVIEAANRQGAARLEPFEQLARAHAGSAAGAKALYLKGFTLSRMFVPAASLLVAATLESR